VSAARTTAFARHANRPDGPLHYVNWPIEDEQTLIMTAALERSTNQSTRFGGMLNFYYREPA
jgi:hypothetical protein